MAYSGVSWPSVYWVLQPVSVAKAMCVFDSVRDNPSATTETRNQLSR